MFYIVHTSHFLHSSFSTLRIFHTPHFPHSAFPYSTFSTLRIFHTPHSSFSTESALTIKPYGVRSCHMFMRTPSLNYFTFAHTRSIRCLSGWVIFYTKILLKVKVKPHIAILCQVYQFCLETINERTTKRAQFSKKLRHFYRVAAQFTSRKPTFRE